MSDKKRIEILISCHKPTAYIENGIMKPIQLNAANSKMHLKNMLRDDKGKNISKLNPMYCELTAQYWAWKNLDADYYGFCHYRRYFSFVEKKYDEDGWGNVVEPYPGEYIKEKYGITEDKMASLIEKYDVLITPIQDLHKMPTYNATVRSHYASAPHLHVKDLDKMLEIIDQKYPEYSESAHEFVDGHRACFCNMYILKKDLFYRYAEWMFGVLEEFCQQTDMSLYDTEALRTPGHLSERLFNIFLLQIQKENPNLKIKELQSVYFKKTDPQEDLSPVFKDMGKTIPIVFAANNGFVAIFAACFQSLIEHLNPKYNYDVILIQSDVNDENKEKLLSMARPHKNLSLRFFDATRLLSNHKLKANAHISVETYYRFLIQEAMPDYDKVLYLDCDLVINGDIAEFYETDIRNYMVAATRDPDFLGQINGANKNTMEYIKTEFHMKNPYNYFQAGVLLFNEEKMREKHSVDEWLRLASKPYLYNDQDVLNLECEGSVKFVDMKWGLIVDHEHRRVSEVISFAPDYIQKEYKLAHANPKIIHFAGYKKPWYDPTEDYATEFWKYARKTAYYEELISHILNFGFRMEHQGRADRRLKHRFKVKAKDTFDKTYAKVAPFGSKRWRMVRKLRGKDCW